MHDAVNAASGCSWGPHRPRPTNLPGGEGRESPKGSTVLLPCVSVEAHAASEAQSSVPPLVGHTTLPLRDSGVSCLEHQHLAARTAF